MPLSSGNWLGRHRAAARRYAHTVQDTLRVHRRHVQRTRTHAPALHHVPGAYQVSQVSHVGLPSACSLACMRPWTDSLGEGFAESKPHMGYKIHGRQSSGYMPCMARWHQVATAQSLIWESFAPVWRRAIPKHACSGAKYFCEHVAHHVSHQGRQGPWPAKRPACPRVAVRWGRDRLHGPHPTRSTTYTHSSTGCYNTAKFSCPLHVESRMQLGACLRRHTAHAGPRSAHAVRGLGEVAATRPHDAIGSSSVTVLPV